MDITKTLLIVLLSKSSATLLLGFSFIYFFILYTGTHMIASSDELNNADKSKSHMTINTGIILEVRV